MGSAGQARVPGRDATGATLEYTGEQLIPGTVSPAVFQQHVARYRFAARFAHNKLVLDAACGVGYGTAILAEVATHVWGVDVKPGCIMFAEQTYGSPRVSFVVGDVLSLPFPPNKFDVYVCLETIEHVADAPRLLEEAARVLKPGGRIVISTPNRRVTNPGKGLYARPTNPFHQREYTLKELTRLLRQAGFVPEEIAGQEWHPVWWVTVRGLMSVPLLGPALRLLRAAVRRLLRKERLAERAGAESGCLGQGWRCLHEPHCLLYVAS